MFFLCLVVAMSSCSKRDVVQDEPIMSPTEEDGGALEGGDVGTGDLGAGDMDAGGGAIRTVYFDFDRYNLTSEARRTLEANADWLKANPTATVQIEGHCDERGTTEYNLALGERRANSALNFLTQLGVDGSRLSTISYGEERSANPGHDEVAWSENRRSEFVILSK